MRPWWQPYVVSVVLGLAWPVASSFPHEMAETGREGFALALRGSLVSWAEGLAVLVPAVIVGAAIGVALGGMWGTKFRWVPGALAAIGTWYAALVLVGLFS